MCAFSAVFFSLVLLVLSPYPFFFFFFKSRFRDGEEKCHCNIEFYQKYFLKDGEFCDGAKRKVSFRSLSFRVKNSLFKPSAGLWAF